MRQTTFREHFEGNSSPPCQYTYKLFFQSQESRPYLGAQGPQGSYKHSRRVKGQSSSECWFPVDWSAAITELGLQSRQLRGCHSINSDLATAGSIPPRGS
jgi:hypothetical protein